MFLHYNTAIEAKICQIWENADLLVRSHGVGGAEAFSFYSLLGEGLISFLNVKNIKVKKKSKAQRPLEFSFKKILFR